MADDGSCRFIFSPHIAAHRCLTRTVKALALFATAGIPGEVLLTSPNGRTASSATIRLSVETIASSSPMVIRFMPNFQRGSFYFDRAIASEL